MICAACGKPAYLRSGWFWHVDDDAETHVVQVLRSASDKGTSEAVPTAGDPDAAGSDGRASALTPDQTEGELRFAWGDR